MNLNVTPENRDKVYDPDPEVKALQGRNKPNSRKLKKSQLDTVPQDKFHTVSILRVVTLTNTLDHLKECG